MKKEFVRRATTALSARPRLEPLEIRANPSRALTVDDDGMQRPNADFSSIQEAVAAAHAGDTIRVFAGTYDEQVTIPIKLNNLELIAMGRPGGVIIAPSDLTADPTEAIIHVAGAKNVTIRGFAISGDAAPVGGGAGADYGVLVDQGGSADVRFNHITAIRDQPLSGAQEGIGVQFGLTDSMGTVLSSGSGEVDHNLIDDYQKGGVVVIGAQSHADIVGNVIRGAGATGVIAQNGIQVSNGATADIERNVVSGNNYTGTEVVAVGILGFQAAGVQITNNLVFDNNDGILLYFTDKSSVEHNASNHNTHFGIGLFESDGNRVRYNVANDNGVDGINIDMSTNNRVEKNFAFDNGRYGIALEATATGNFVRFNHLGDNVEDDIFVGNPDNVVSNNHIHP